MAYGFEAKNDSGKVIINDTIENLHFIGKATRGSSSTGYGDFPNYSGSNDTLDGRVVHEYRITSAGTPLVFIKPNDYGRWHGIVRQYWQANLSLKNTLNLVKFGCSDGFIKLFRAITLGKLISKEGLIIFLL